MLAQQRRLQIIDMLAQSKVGIISVEEFCHALHVSDMTIRRDLNDLEGQGLIRRIHGGAVLLQGAAPEKGFAERHADFSDEKEGIGAAAAKLILNGESIILDAGTTTQQIARHLTSVEKLTVVTHTLPIAQELTHCPGVQTIILGGILKPRELCTVGPTTTQELARLSVDKVFLSAAGFSLSTGATDPDFREAEVKEAMIRAAREVILVADSSKWGLRALVHITPLRSIHKLVTDAGLPAEAATTLRAEGVEVIIADPQKSKGS